MCVCVCVESNAFSNSVKVLECFAPYIMDSPSSINTRQRECQTGVHQSAWHNHVWYHLRSGWIVTTTLDCQLSTNYRLFNQVNLYLVSVTWIYIFFFQTFCVRRVFLWSASQHKGRKKDICVYGWVYIYIYIYGCTCIYTYSHTHTFTKST